MLKEVSLYNFLEFLSAIALLPFSNTYSYSWGGWRWGEGDGGMAGGGGRMEVGTLAGLGQA